MRKDRRIKEMTQLHAQLTDPDERAKAKRITEREQRKEEKRADTGL